MQPETDPSRKGRSRNGDRKPTSSSFSLDSASSVFCSSSQLTSSSSLSSASVPLIVLLSSSAPSSSSCRLGLKLLLGTVVTGLRASLGSNGELRGLELMDSGLNVLARRLLLSWIVGEPVGRVDDSRSVLRVSCLAGGSERRMETRESWSTIRFTSPSSGVELLRCRVTGEVGEGTAVAVERFDAEEACLCSGPDPTAPTGLRVSRSASIRNGRAGSRPEPWGCVTRGSGGRRIKELAAEGRWLECSGRDL